GGLYRIRGSDNSTQHFNTASGLLNNAVSSLMQDNQGNLWIGTMRGLHLFKDGKLSAHTEIRGVLSLYQDRRNNIWIGTVSGAYVLQNERSVQKGLADHAVVSILEDRHGNLWFGTNGVGLYRYNNGTFSPFTKQQGLSSDFVWALHEDPEGSLWVGTTGGGINRFNDGNFVTVGNEEGMLNDKIWSIYGNKNQEVWFGTEGGISKKQKDGKFLNYTTKQGLSSDTVWCVFEDSKGNVWAGTGGYGLNRCKDGKCKTYTTKDGLGSNYIWSILEDQNGGIWLGVEGSGLTYFKDEKFTVHPIADTTSSRLIHSILQDKDGSLWIGTEGSGLNRYKDGKFTSYTTKQGLSFDQIMSMYMDHDGSLWLGTRGGGLNRFAHGKFTSFKRENGLFDDLIHQILDDDQGNLWMTSNRGIFRVSKKDLNDFSAGHISRITSTSFGPADGIRSSECNGGYQPGAWKSPDGKLWFPTIRGAAVVDPIKMDKNKVPPPTYIEKMIADGKEPTERVQNLIVLPPGQEKFEFHYTALSFLVPDKMQFKYKLEGFDRDWVNAMNRRVAYYTNVPPGKYQFKVIASNNDGVWNDAGAELPFQLKPYFYQTGWFFAACIAAAIAAGWMLYRLRLRKVKAEFAAVLAERSRMAREIHDTLAQGFTGILMQLEAAEESGLQMQSNRHLVRVKTLAKESLNEARRTVWALRPQALESSELPSALSEEAKKIIANTPLIADVKISGTPRKLADELEENLLRIGQEAITNSVKHSHAKSVLVELTYGTNQVSIKIKDDGIGFNSNSGVPEGHFGLLGMRERVSELKGTFDLRSEPNKGTELIVTIPSR
ncbi:MAG TPA: two-component regulator propeller domain-containing protein, partial [Acidobacteriota bacterium]|nr:two-component regulator propeller domain-containing protein [Acidobacteriota bacterium]